MSHFIAATNYTTAYMYSSSSFIIIVSLYYIYFQEQINTHTHTIRVDMMENEHQHDKQELRQYCEVSNRGSGFAIATDHDHDHHAGDQGMRMKPHHDHQVNNKHSYFLRAKSTPRILGFHVGDEDGEFKKPSPIRRVGSTREEEELANCLVMLSNKPHAISTDEKEESYKGKEVVEKGTFQCKACKKVFNSHQALGGHRASHKKVKGCFASKIEGLNDDENVDDQDSIQEDQEPPPPPEPDTTLRPTPSASARKRTKMHECSVCRRVFSSGQALGGHKRCHWLTTSTDNAFIPNFHDFQYDPRSQQLCKKPLFTKAPHHHDHQLDLNLPPAAQRDQVKRDNGDDNDDDDGGDNKTSKYEESTRLCLQQWTDQNQQKTGDDVMDRSSEEELGMKLIKLSDLRDVNLDGGWLQMGIPSTSEMR